MNFDMGTGDRRQVCCDSCGEIFHVNWKIYGDALIPSGKNIWIYLANAKYAAWVVVKHVNIYMTQTRLVDKTDNFDYDEETSNIWMIRAWQNLLYNIYSSCSVNHWYRCLILTALTDVQWTDSALSCRWRWADVGRWSRGSYMGNICN